MKTTQLAVFSLEDGGTIRVTADGRPSIYDIIKVLGGKKNARATWDRIAKAHPEVVRLADNWKFSGARQRETPVAKDKAAAYQILGLLEGTVGAAYRKAAAELFVAFMDNPAALAERIVDELDPEEQRRIEARLRGKRVRFNFTDALSEAGAKTQDCYRKCTDEVYLVRLGHTAQNLKRGIVKAKGLRAKHSSITLRDHLRIEDLETVEQTEQASAGQLRLAKEQGRLNGEDGSFVRERDIHHTVSTTARYLHDLMNGRIAVPGL
jgi:hypothetical protein